MEFRIPVEVTYVVHIGAGFGADAQAYASERLAPIVLAEADPEASAQLEKLTSQYPDLHVVQAAISGQSSLRPFYRTNFSELNSLLRPSGIQDMFPGLEIQAQDRVETLSVSEMLIGLDLPSAGGLLVLEAPGMALEILEALSAVNEVERFSAIRVQEGRGQLYEGASTQEEVQSCLSGLGYQVWEDPKVEDSDRPYLVAVRSGFVSEITRALSTLSQALFDSEEDANVLRQERDQLAATEGQRAEQVAKLEVKLEGANVLRQERDQLAATEGQRAEQVAKLEVKLEGATQDLAAEKKKSLSEVDFAQKSLGLALRVQALREADLRELQRRYADLLSQKDAQDSLLQRLSVRLDDVLQEGSTVATVDTRKVSGTKRKVSKPSGSPRSDKVGDKA